MSLRYYLVKFLHCFPSMCFLILLCSANISFPFLYLKMRRTWNKAPCSSVHPFVEHICIQRTWIGQSWPGAVNLQYRIITHLLVWWMYNCDSFGYWSCKDLVVTRHLFFDQQMLPILLLKHVYLPWFVSCIGFCKVFCLILSSVVPSFNFWYTLIDLHY